MGAGLPDFANDRMIETQRRQMVADNDRLNAYRDEVGAIPTPYQMAQQRAAAQAQAQENTQATQSFTNSPLTRSALAGLSTAPNSEATPTPGVPDGSNITSNIVANGLSLPNAHTTLPTNSRDAGVLAPSAMTPVKKGITAAIGASNSSGVNDQIQPTIADQIDYMRKTAEVARKHGQLSPANIVQMENVIGNMKAEGMNHAVALWDRGDVQGGEQVFNSIGGVRGKVLGVKDGTYMAGGQKLPTKLVTFQHVDDSGNPVGAPSIIDTAHFMHAASGIDNMINQGQKGDDTRGALLSGEGALLRGQADLLKANAEKKNGSPEQRRALVNDGVKQLDAAYGIKRDPITNMIDPDSIKNKPGYYQDIKTLEQRVVDGGEAPMAVASDLADKAMRKQKINDPQSHTTATPASKDYSHLWNQ